MTDNVIELIVKTTDQASQGLKAISGQVDSVGKAFESIKGLAEGAIAGFSLEKLVESITGAQQATADLDRQFAQFGSTVGLTEESMTAFAETTSKATTLTSESLKEAQANLLNYTNLTGQAFVDARGLVVDLAAKMGGDAADAATLLGRALQNPVSGIRLLAQVGVTLTQSQRATIASLEQTGGAAQATAFIMDTLKQHLAGAADAATNTLGGALTQLKNSFANGFTGAGADLQGLTDSIHALNDQVNDADFQHALQGVTSSIVDIASAAIQAVGGIRSLAEGLAHLINGADTPEGRLLDEKKAIEDLISSNTDPETGTELAIRLATIQIQLDKIKTSADAATAALNPIMGGTGFGANHPGSWDNTPPKKPPPLFDELEKQITLGPNAVTLQHAPGRNALTEFYQSELDDLGDSLDKANTDFAKHQAERTDLLAQGLLTPSKAAQQTADELDKLLPQITTTAKQIAVPLDAIDKQGQQVAQDLTNSFTSFFESGDLSARNFLKTMLTVFDQIVAKALATDIVGSLGLSKLFDQPNGSGSQIGGLLGAFGGLFGGNTSNGVASDAFLNSNDNNDRTSQYLQTGLAALFGFAGGGQVAGGPMIVGEDGPELFVPGVSGTVMNQRQMAFAGGGGGQGLVYSPQNTIYLTTDNSDKNAAALGTYLTQQQRQQQAEFERKLARNGIKLRS